MMTALQSREIGDCRLGWKFSDQLPWASPINAFAMETGGCCISDLVSYLVRAQQSCTADVRESSGTARRVSGTPRRVDQVEAQFPARNQIRCTVAGDKPTRAAIVRHDQRFLPRRERISGEIQNLFNLRGSDRRLPAAPPGATFPNLTAPSTENWARQERTVPRLTPTPSAIRVLATPLAAKSNARARTTCRYGAVWEHASRFRMSRSPSVRGNGGWSMHSLTLST